MTTFMKSICQSVPLLIVCSVLWSCAGGSNSALPASAVSPCSAQDPECHSIVVGGVTRTYVLHVPTSFQMGTGSLVLVLHGSGQNAAGIEDLSRFVPRQTRRDSPSRFLKDWSSRRSRNGPFTTTILLTMSLFCAS